MADTHDYETRTVAARELDETMTLVGKCGGLSSVLLTPHVPPFAGSTYPVYVSTEHGIVTFQCDDPVEVLDLP